jgi:Na+:H+ antiporter, NhaA family
MRKTPSSLPPLFSRGSWPEVSRVTALLRKETVGGTLLLVATVAALTWANSPWSETYFTLRDLQLGPAALHLNISVGAWASDGLLAIFFFVVGLELKREFVAGDLRNPRRAALPIAAAIGGMVLPAGLFVLINLSRDASTLMGWAIPVATDIAFALAVLALISTHLPAALRTFLLTLAVVDDLFAISIIAIFYTRDLHVAPLLMALLPLAIFGFLVQRRIQAWWLLVPLAVAVWAFVHASGVHATVAGVLLGFTVPVLSRDAASGLGLAERLEHLLRPLSAGVAVPIFAFFAAGVTISGLAGLTEALTARITIGIVVGLVVGKAVGIFATSYLVARFTRASLNPDLRWVDVVGVATLAGIGFTVSLLIGELAYGVTDDSTEYVRIGVLAGSLLAAALAAVILRRRNRVYRELAAIEERDSDADGIPDVYDTTTLATTDSSRPTVHNAAGNPRGSGVASGTAEKEDIFHDKHSDSAAPPVLILVSTHKYLDAVRHLVGRAREVLQPLSRPAARVMQVEVYGDQNADPGGLRTCDFACTGHMSPVFRLVLSR